MSVFGFKFIEEFKDIYYGDYLSLLCFVLDDKINPNPVKGRILFKATNKKLESVFKCSNRSLQSKMKLFAEKGLITTKYKSSVKGIPSEYYIHCPATVLIDKLGLNKPKKESKKETEDTEFW